MGDGGAEVLTVEKIAEYAVGECDAIWVCVGGVELGLVCEGDGGAVGGEVVVWVMVWGRVLEDVTVIGELGGEQACSL